MSTPALRYQFILCPGAGCDARAALDTTPAHTPTPVYCATENRFYARPAHPAAWADSGPGMVESATANAALDAVREMRESGPRARGGDSVAADGRGWGHGMDAMGREMPAKGTAPAHFATPAPTPPPPDAPTPTAAQLAELANAGRALLAEMRRMQQPAPAPVQVSNAAPSPGMPPDGSVWTALTGWMMPRRRR